MKIAFAIVCPMLFLAGFVDSIAGGGGLISLPAYLFAGLPIHTAIGTNKFSSAFGTGLSTFRYIRQNSMLASELLLQSLLLAVLPAAAFCVLNKRLFKGGTEDELTADKKTFFIVMASALAIGMYDGLYGPGTGTFLIIAFTALAKMSVRQANAHAKVINFSTNIAALFVYLLHGQVLFPLGIAAALSNMLGNYLGSSLVLSKSERIVKPLVIFVLLLLLAKIIFDMKIF